MFVELLWMRQDLCNLSSSYKSMPRLAMFDLVAWSCRDLLRVASGSVRLCRKKSIENGLKYCFGPRLKREGSRSTFSAEIAKEPFSIRDIVFALALALRSSSKLYK